MLLSDEKMQADIQTARRWQQDSKPTIDFGTDAPDCIEQILVKLAHDWFIGDIVRSCHLESDAEVLAAVAYAETLPADGSIGRLLQQYRENRKTQVLAVVATFKQSLQAIYGERLVQMVLFGSQARGEARPNSDIDVLVVLKGPFQWLRESERISPIVADLSLRYTELLNCVLMDEPTFLQQSEPLLENIRQEGVRV